MRIDFSRLQNHQIQSSIINATFSNSLSNLWKEPQSKTLKIHQPKVCQQSSPTISFSVEYPFQVNRSISTNSFKKCLDYLQAKKELPSSTLKFIKNHLDLDMKKQINKVQSIQRQKNKVDEMQNLPKKESLNPKQLIQQQRRSLNNNCLPNKINKNIAKVSNKTSISNKYTNIKPRVYQPKLTKLRSQKYYSQPDLEELTLKPMLNYTMNSKTSMKVNKKRNHHFKTCQINVFQSLYNDASLYTTKRNLQKAIIQQESIQSKSIVRRSSKVKVNSTFQQRLQSSIQKTAQRMKKANNKLDFDPNTGKKYFVPDTSRSKQTFNSHFRSHKLSILPPQETCFPARGIHYSQDSEKMNRSQEMTTTLNNSYEKDLNKSLDGKYAKNRRSVEKENKLAAMYTQLLWDEDCLKEQLLSIPQKKVLESFLKNIKQQSIKHNYSKNIKKQLFVMHFNTFYNSLNLFDRSILSDRFKKSSKLMNNWLLSKKMENNLSKLSDKMSLKSRKAKPNISFYHNKLSYYI